jgi:hypothetical protein
VLRLARLAPIVPVRFQVLKLRLNVVASSHHGTTLSTKRLASIPRPVVQRCTSISCTYLIHTFAYTTSTETPSTHQPGLHSSIPTPTPFKETSNLLLTLQQTDVVRLWFGQRQRDLRKVYACCFLDQTRSSEAVNRWESGFTAPRRLR